ncbi:MAG: hypothetical protein IKQ10_06855 [Oscillospiraceae bacterium]|nr:hypothetical protein [Oscillospiraceae bacterium]
MNRHRQITAFYIETLVLILVFVSIILVLTGVFSLSKRDSREARRLTNAVTLSQSAAEAVSASGSEDELFALLDRGGNAVRMTGASGVTAFYDTDMRPDPQGALRVEVTWQPEMTGTGTIVRSVILARYSGEEEPVYRLETAVLLGEVSP